MVVLVLTWMVEVGGWDTKDTHFNVALLVKDLWRTLNNDGIWQQFIRAKFLKTE